MCSARHKLLTKTVVNFDKLNNRSLASVRQMYKVIKELQLSFALLLHFSWFEEERKKNVRLSVRLPMQRLHLQQCDVSVSRAETSSRSGSALDNPSANRHRKGAQVKRFGQAFHELP
ncbi:hypothetical protein RRG08_056490 [Elysia crispata]|uniref:Uncharacterized protein n=1 Tax=Elysia crispata TaxID=231223 RepID=A0AAE0XS33_9GAST|nr:hypothetical protein RRG08_056490 [Elysia crispata]